MDVLGKVLWILMFLTPFITIPIVWKISKRRKLAKLLLSLLFAFILSLVLYFLSIAIIFREGMGA